MGISSTLYSGYSKQEIETNRIPTPFGDATVSMLKRFIHLKFFSSDEKMIMIEYHDAADIMDIELL